MQKKSKAASNVNEQVENKKNVEENVVQSERKLMNEQVQTRETLKNFLQAEGEISHADFDYIEDVIAHEHNLVQNELKSQLQE